MTTLRTFLLLIVSFQMLMSQDVPIEVKVRDYDDRQPLIGASVFIDGQAKGATDLEGRMVMLISPGSHKVKVTFIGYDAYTSSFNTSDLEGPILDLLLKPSAALLNTATVTGSRYERPLSESSVSLDVLKAEVISRTAAPDIEEVLNRMPGVQLLGGQANIRGGSGWSYGAGSRVLLLLDDIPILQVDAALPNWNDVPIENISQVEILKGAASALYGSSALNGIINIQTDYAKSEPETVVSTQGTHFFMPDDSTDYDAAYNFLISAMHRRKIGKVDLVLGGMYRNTERFRVGTLQKYGRLNANIRYRIKDNMTLGVNSIFTPGKSRNYFYWDAKDSYRGEAQSYSNTSRLRFNVDPYLKWHTGNWSHKILSRIYRTRNDNDNDQSNASWLAYGEYQSRYSYEPWGIDVVGGLVFTNTNVDAELYGDSDFNNRNVAVYTQLEKRLFDKLILTGGIRYEHNTLEVPEVVDGDTIPNGEITESRPVFRFGANYQVAEYSFLRASWGQGYRFPSIAEKFIDTQAGALRIRPNTGLKSEDGWSGEIGIRQGVGNKKWNGYIDLAYFWSEYEDMMEFSVSKADNGELFFQSQNVGGTIIKGLEANAFMSGGIGLSEINFLVGYTYIDPRFSEFDETGNNAVITDPDLTQAQQNAAKSTSEDNILKYRSKHNFKFDFQMSYRNVFGGVGYNYTSEMLAIDKVLVFQVQGLDAPQDDDKAGFNTLDFRIGYEWSNLKFQLQLKNAFDERYTARPAFLEAPRNITFRVDWRF